MRCLACNANLSNYESTRKYSAGSFIDLCNNCFSGLDIIAVGRPDLMEEEDNIQEIQDV